MTKRTAVEASGTKPGSPQRDSRLDEGIARAAAAVLGQVFQWRTDLTRTRGDLREPGRFDVQAVFDALNDK